LAQRKDGAVKGWTRPPFQAARLDKKAKSNDPSTWGTYEEAHAAVKAGKADGIGFMLKDSEIAAVEMIRLLGSSLPAESLGFGDIATLIENCDGKLGGSFK
jgi:hypothetical protein